MTAPPGPEPRGSGTEAREAVEAVLRDQAERAGRRDAPPPPRGDRRPLLRVLFLVLLATTVWFLLAPPAFLVPPPPPPPSPAKLDAGLRMDLFVVASSLDDYRDVHGRYPTTLLEALEGPEDAEGIDYEVMAGGWYRLVGQRDTLVVVYESTESLRGLTSPALDVVRGGGGP